MSKLNCLIVKEHKLEKATIENSLQSFYKIIGCKYIEMPVRKIGDKNYVIICDEEFLLKEHTNDDISAVWFKDRLVQEVFMGNLIIVNNDYENGNVASLDLEDIKRISDNFDGGLLHYNL